MAEANGSHLRDSYSHIDAPEVELQNEAVDDRDDQSVVSTDSGDSIMEPFEVYKPKVEQLLHDIGLTNCHIEVLQHGHNFQNCVYALTTPSTPEDKYVLRVPVDPDLREEDGVCEAIINDAALLAYIADKLPVPRVIAYSATGKNALGTPFTVQTRLPGVSLDEVYDNLDHDEKLTIVDQYIGLLARIESIQFPASGTFAASQSVSTSTYSFSATLPHTLPHTITSFKKGDDDFVQDPNTAINCAGPNLKAFVVSHVEGWIQKERKHSDQYQESSLTIPYYQKLLAMLDALEGDGAFEDKHQPIVLHHWDLEPRNIMVLASSSGYQITGLIDWDDALALPRPLARQAPDWIWNCNFEPFTGYLDTDHHPKTELQEANLALKEYYDEKAGMVLGDRYLNDAYGQARWLRRIWTFAKGGVYSTWYWDLIKLLVEDWESQTAQLELSSSNSPISEEQVAEEVVEALLPQKPVGYLGKVGYWLRCLKSKVLV
ncbi:MAG: hypothetical protein Q9209_004834 [Squamulea sp. 1 TL-2023]